MFSIGIAVLEISCVCIKAVYRLYLAFKGRFDKNCIKDSIYMFDSDLISL